LGTGKHLYGNRNKFPNFGNSEYVTGLRTNTRTVVVNFVFKRISDGKEEAKKPEKKSEQKK